MNRLKYSLLALLVLSAIHVSAQEDPMAILNAQQPKEKPLAIATFKTTRLINFHTIETCGRRTLDFRISHRFGAINSGIENFWGIDGGASIRLGLEYSHDGRLQFGFGRTSYQKMLDGFVKYRLLRQTEGKGMPVSLTLFSAMYCNTSKDPLKEVTGFDRYANAYSRLSYCHQIIIGRKFSKNLSVQLAPWFIHYNQVDQITDANDMFGLAGAIRYKVTRSLAITGEYGLRINEYTNRDYYNSFGLGFEVETGGHVFQMHITNSFGLVENQFLPFTDTKWGNAGIRLGFNISRVFAL